MTGVLTVPRVRVEDEVVDTSVSVMEVTMMWVWLSNVHVSYCGLRDVYRGGGAVWVLDHVTQQWH